MVTIKKHGVLLEKTANNFENLGVFNTAITQDSDTLHMLYRVARNGNFSTLGYCKLDGPLSIVERKKELIFFP